VSRYLLVEDAAAMLGVSKDVIYRMASEGRCPHRRIGGTRRLLFLEDELHAWVDGAELETVKTPNGGRVVRPVENGSAG
jgi:excisionase family DNA binding protein